MSWADSAKAALREGRTVTIRPRGHSMKGRVNDGDMVTVEPCVVKDVKVGDVVLVRVNGNDYLHLVKAISGDRLLIGNNRGGINGWIGEHGLYGKAVRVEKPNG